MKSFGLYQFIGISNLSIYFQLTEYVYSKSMRHYEEKKNYNQA